MPNEQELLDTDLGKLDTSFTVIQGGIFDLVIKENTVAPNSANDGDLWTVQLSTTTPTISIKGEQVAPGHTLFHRISLKVTEKRTKEMIGKSAARFLQAVKPAVSGIKVADLFNGEIKTKCKILNGHMVRAKVDAMPEGRTDKKTGKSLDASNEISKFFVQ